MTAIPTPQYTDRDFDLALANLQSFVTQTRPDLLTDLTSGGLTTLLLELIARGIDITSFAVDSAINESFVPTMLRRDSALRFAASVGYTPRNASAASVTVQTATLPAAVTAAGGTISAGVLLTGPNGLEWYLEEDVTISISDTTATFTLEQKKFWSDTFSPTNKPDLKIKGRSGPVNAGDFEVYVGDPTNTANLWIQVDAIALELSATETYEATYDAQGRLIITFGDGLAGAIPDQEITVQYYTTQGADGNVPIGALSKQIAVTSGGNIYQVTITSTTAATGGQDQETLEELRVALPAHIRSGGRAITLKDFEHQAKQVPGILLAYADMRFSSYAGSVVDVNIWSSEEVTFTSESVIPSQQSQRTYVRPAQANTSQVQAVKARLAQRTMTGVLPTISNPAVSYVDIYLGDVYYDEGYNFRTVHQSITNRVVAAFEASNGFAIRLSSIYDAVSDTDGVLRNSIERIVYESNQPGKATGQIVMTSNPSDGDWIEINDGSNTYRFEFDDDSDLITSNAYAVTIANATHDTMANLVSIINSTIRNINAEKSSSATPTANLNQQLGGTLYNNAIAKSGSTITVTGMGGGTDTTTLTQEDFRTNTCLSAAADPYPPGTYAAGAPFTGSSSWQEGGIEPYYDLRDIETYRDRESRAFYNEALVVNNTIVYGYQAGLTQALVLRRLKFNLIADARE